MDASLRLRSVQHDSRVVIPSTLFCHSERSEESIAWMLRFAQHDKRCHSERERGIQCVDASL